MSGKSAKVVLDNLGLSVKDKAANAYSLPTSKDDKGFWDWSTTNLNAFIGVNHENEGLLYVNGQMNIQGGSRIAGWTIDNEKIYNGSGINTTFMSASGTPVSGNGLNSGASWQFYANNNFGVTAGGILYARGAVIGGNSNFEGKINVTDSGSSINNGVVGGWNASSSGLKVTGIELSPTGGTQHTVNGQTGSNWALWANDNFGVTTDGKLYSNGAKIKGHIEADSGTIGGCSISNGVLQIKNANIDTLSVSKITGGSNSATITFAGNITCNNLTAKTSGNVGGWTIHSDKLKSSSGNVLINSLTKSDTFTF
jgi:hypothetical protein